VLNLSELNRKRLRVPSDALGFHRPFPKNVLIDS
jgi:hypothetical protein